VIEDLTPDVPEAPRRKTPIQREWAVQRGVKFFVKRCVAVEHEFAAHDRGFARSEYEHIGEAARGIRRAWMDTELALKGGRTFRCELKAPGVRIDKNGDQWKLIHRMNDIGHPTWWANSVRGYALAALDYGVPILGNWETVAQHADELVAADIREQEAKAEKKRAGTYKSKPRAARPTRGQVAAGHRFTAARLGLGK
jgi:hypothetical protein